MGLLILTIIGGIIFYIGFGSLISYLEIKEDKKFERR